MLGHTSKGCTIQIPGLPALLLVSIHKKKHCPKSTLDPLWLGRCNMAPLGPMVNFYVPILRCRLYIYIYIYAQDGNVWSAVQCLQCSVNNTACTVKCVCCSVYSRVLTMECVQCNVWCAMCNGNGAKSAV